MGVIAALDDDPARVGRKKTEGSPHLGLCLEPILGRRNLEDGEARRAQVGRSIGSRSHEDEGGNGGRMIMGEGGRHRTALSMSPYRPRTYLWMGLFDRHCPRGRKLREIEGETRDEDRVALGGESRPQPGIGFWGDSRPRVEDQAHARCRDRHKEHSEHLAMNGDGGAGILQTRVRLVGGRPEIEGGSQREGRKDRDQDQGWRPRWRRWIVHIARINPSRHLVKSGRYGKEWHKAV